MTRLNIFHLYPDHLNLYGDRGNILALLRRARWHGLTPRLVPVYPGYKVDFKSCDLLFMGGGQDVDQKRVIEELQEHRPALEALIEKGMVILAVCGSYQLLGRYYLTTAGEKIPGLELLDLYSEAGASRITGNIVIRCGLWQPSRTLVGFENHAGRTYLGAGMKPLGRVVRGCGNNGRDRTEGVVYKNVIATYLHGSLLPKNPHLADYIIERALCYRGVTPRLRRLDDVLEMEAHCHALKLK